MLKTSDEDMLGATLVAIGRHSPIAAEAAPILCSKDLTKRSNSGTVTASMYGGRAADHREGLRRNRPIVEGRKDLFGTITAMQLIDSHCHLDFEAFDDDREAVLASAVAAGVGTIVVPGVKRETWRRLVKLCAGHGGLYYALGLHPKFVDAHRPEHLDDLAEAIASLSPVAVGEIGLDYYEKDADRKTQQRLFERQLDIARTHALPVILHVRKAHDEVLELLRVHGIHGGIAHAFNGSGQQAHKYMDLGFKLGFGGTLTFERSRKIRELAKRLPLEALVLETDAPDMTVAQHRGKRNSPEYIPYVLEALASVRSEPVEEIAAATTQNTAAVLRLEVER